jgi:hypothetical protein
LNPNIFDKYSNYCSQFYLIRHLKARSHEFIFFHFHLLLSLILILRDRHIDQSLELLVSLFFILAHVSIQQIKLNNHIKDFNILNAHIFFVFLEFGVIFEHFIVICLNFLIICHLIVYQ